MTKRRDIIKKIRSEARAKGVSFETREGGNHTVCTVGGIMIPIARHNEIADLMAKIIYQECEEALGKDWWK
jgi:hypothetical protein